MAIILNDNIKVNAGKPSEAKYLNPNTNLPYSGITQVNTLVPISERHRGLTVLINDTEYWYRNGLTNSDLILKTTSGTGTGERIEKTFTQLSHSFLSGEVVEYSGGTFIKALAIADRNSEIIGWISNVNGDDFTVVIGGYIDGISGLTLSANTTYYLSDIVAGALTPIEPTAVGTKSKPILTTLTTNDAIVFQYRELVNATGVTLPNISGLTEVVNIGFGNGLIYDTSYTATTTVALRTISGGTGINVSTTGNVIRIDNTATGSTTFANNGLIKLGDTIVLGGVLTGDTTISGAGNSLYIGDYDTSELTEFNVAVSGTSGLIGLYGKDNSIIEISTNHTVEDSIVVSAGLSQDNSKINIDYEKLRLSSNDAEPASVFIELSGASKIIIGEENFPNFAGAQYLSDYSSNYTARSIPDVGFVTGYTTPQNIYTQKVIINSNTTLTNTNFIVFVDSSTSGLTITFPALPVDGQLFRIKDIGNALVNNIIIDGNGKNIEGTSQVLINTSRGAIDVIYDLNLDEWIVLNFIS